jgi:hypothetical protein
MWHVLLLAGLSLFGESGAVIVTVIGAIMNMAIQKRCLPCRQDPNDRCPLDGRQTGYEATNAQRVRRLKEMRETEKALDIRCDQADSGLSCVFVTH